MMDALTITIILGTSLFLIISFFFITIVLLYKKKQSIYQEEILKINIEIQEQNLKFISSEIHDNIGPTLTLAKIHLTQVKIDNNPMEEHKLHEAIGIITNVLEAARELSHSTSKDYLNERNLSELVRFELNIRQKVCCIKTNLQVLGYEESYGDNRHLLIFRIIQEALHNIIKHAAAQSILVEINYFTEFLLVKIVDDGNGFNFNKRTNAGLGILNMQNRAKLANGLLTINSVPGKGTSVELKIHK